MTKIDGTTIDDAENLDFVMPMYNLLEYSSNSSDTTGSLWFYSNGEENNFDVDIVDGIAFEHLKYRAIEKH